MSAAKHTPGPWRADFDDEHVFDGIQIIADGKSGFVPVANVPVDFDDRPERESNARLIAAAPDAFAILKSMPFEPHPPNPNDTGSDCLCAKCEFIRSVRAFITKVEGGAVE